MYDKEMIRNHRYHLAKALDAANKGLIEFRKAIQELAYDLSQHCAHENCSYEPDPSGNNDSYYDCSDCGGNWRRKPDPCERASHVYLGE